MVLSQTFEKFIEESPVSVMVRGLLERTFSLAKLDQWYEEVANNQYTRELLFSSIFDLMHQVVFKIYPSIHTAYQKTSREKIGVSLTSVYNKINGMETTTASASGQSHYNFWNKTLIK